MGSNGKGKKAARESQRKGKQPEKRASLANKKAEELTADLVDHRLTKALAHPLRTAILTVANLRPISPSQYAREFGSPLSNVSYHFRKLRDYDCIELVEEIPVGGSHAHVYQGSHRGILTGLNWKALGKSLQAGHRITVIKEFTARCLEAVDAETMDSREEATLYWIAGVIDEPGWVKFTEVLVRTIEEVAEIEIESVQRRAEGISDECIPVTFGIAGFESPRAEAKDVPKKKPRRKSKGERGRK